MKKYRIAIYMRLSKEDDKLKIETPSRYSAMPCDRKGESNSIAIQEPILSDQVLGKEGI